MNGVSQRLAFEDFFDKFIKYMTYEVKDSDLGRINSSTWKGYISRVCNKHYELGTYLSENKDSDLELAQLYLDSGEILANELIFLEEYRKAEAIYHHLGYYYKKFHLFTDENIVEKYSSLEEYCKEQKTEQQGKSGCGCVLIVVAIIIAYFLFF